MSSAVLPHLSDLLRTLYGGHLRDEREFAKLTDAQREQRWTKLGISGYWRDDAWAMVVAEVAKRSGISTSRFAEFAGRENPGTLDGVEDVAAAVAKLHDNGLTPWMLSKLADEYAQVVADLDIGILPKVGTARVAEEPSDGSSADTPSSRPVTFSGETPLKLADAARALPSHRSKTTIWRWCVKGINGVKLEHRRVGREIWTTAKLRHWIGSRPGSLTLASDALPTCVPHYRMRPPMLPPCVGRARACRSLTPR